MTRQDVIVTARAWLDTPFIPQQSRRGVGCDCAGLVIGVAKELGLVPQDFSVIYKQEPNGTMRKLCDQYLRRVPKPDAQAGDVVMMQFRREPQHLGILVPYGSDWLAVIHALTRSEKVIEHRLDERWRRFIVGAYAFPGVD